MLGVLVALPLFEGSVKPGISFKAFGLFMGIAMSITAFPVLARILGERRMLSTPIGSLALTCAAVNDVTAWALLAFVVAVVTSGGSLVTVAVTLGLTVLFVLVKQYVMLSGQQTIVLLGSRASFRPAQLAVRVYPCNIWQNSL